MSRISTFPSISRLSLKDSGAIVPIGVRRGCVGGDNSIHLAKDDAANFALNEFCELRPDGVLRSCLVNLVL